MTLLDAALNAHAAGLAVIPVRTDGSKAPAVNWKEFQDERPDVDQLTAWFSPQPDPWDPTAPARMIYDGLGYVCGEISGHLEMLEIEGRAADLVPQLATLMADHGFGELWTKICSGYLEQSPSGGLHWLYRVDGPMRGNTKLARRPMTPEELAAHKAHETEAAQRIDNHSQRAERLRRIEALTPASLPVVLIETRGSGGFTVAAPSAGRSHPTGKPWLLLAGTPATIPTLTVDERDTLHVIANMLDQMPEVAEPPRPAAPGQGATTTPGERPGDDYNARATWDDILTPLGWQRVRHFGGTCYGWTRPGKHARDGISATTGRNEADNLYVFTSSTEFDTERAYSKFAAHALLEHGGDYAAAAKALRAQGYGKPLEEREGLSIEARAENASTQPVTPTPPAATTTKPELDVSNSAVMAEWLRTNVGAGPLAGMFLRGNEIVHTPRVGQDGYTPATARATDDDGPAQVRVIKKSTLASRVQYAYECFKWVKRDGDLVKTPGIFPVDAARVASDAPDMLTNLRPLVGVIHAPVLRSDGSILDTPGYDDETGLLYLPSHNLAVPTVPDQPNRDDIAAAVALLDEMTDGFPFVTENDRANYYGLLLTPILRVIAPAPYKLIAITAPQPGSGKTLLASTARAIHGGVFRAEFPEDDAELRKQITSILTVTTGQLVHIDNVSGTLRSSTLAGLLTSATWGDRVLGATEWAAAPNDRVWVITGNNILLGGDLERRSLWINIDPRMPHPEERTGFAIPDLERWATENRGRLLHALLTLARAWQVAGQPVGAQRSSDGYSRWVEVVSGILEHAGVPGRFGETGDSADKTIGADDDEWSDFLAAIYEAMGDREWSVKELLQKIDTTSRFDPWTEQGHLPIKLSTLPADLPDKAMRPAGLQGIARSLGMWLRNRQGRWAGDYTVRFVRVGHARERFWQIERAARHLAPVGGTGDTGDSVLGSPEVENGDNDVSGDSKYLPYAQEKQADITCDAYVNGPERQSPQTPLSPHDLKGLGGAGA